MNNAARWGATVALINREPLAGTKRTVVASILR